MLSVHNLKTDAVIQFDDQTAPAYAVRYCHITEDCPQHASWFFAAIQDRKQAEINERLPVIVGKTSISCGDWATTLYPFLKHTPQDTPKQHAMKNEIRRHMNNLDSWATREANPDRYPGEDWTSLRNWTQAEVARLTDKLLEA